MQKNVNKSQIGQGNVFFKKNMATLYRREWETAVCEDERQIGLITSASAFFHA